MHIRESLAGSAGPTSPPGVDVRSTPDRMPIGLTRRHLLTSLGLALGLAAGVPAPAQAEEPPAQAQEQPAQAQEQPAQAQEQPAQTEEPAAQAQEQPAQAQAPATLLRDEANRLFELINAFRQERQRQPLSRWEQLDEVARLHALDMAQHNFVGHTSSDGTGAIDRIRRYFPYNTVVGENVAGGFETAEAVLQAWKESSGHRLILLHPDLRVIGLAGASNPEVTYRWFWTADFGGQPDRVSE